MERTESALSAASFIYDGLGRRQKKTIGASPTEFLYDGVNPVQETSGATVLANILTGLGIDEFFSRTDVPAATTSHFLPDGLRSAVALTDPAGAVQTEYTYEPFGRTTVTGVSSSNPFQYTGRENDGTGLYYYRARYYYPLLQRFVSEDPPTHAFGQGEEIWSPTPYLKFNHEAMTTAGSMLPQVDPIFAVKVAQGNFQTLPITQLALAQLSCGRAAGGPDYGNLYAYVSNNPINGTDPSGLGRPGECVQYIYDCLKGANAYSCVAIVPCVTDGTNERSNCMRNCLLNDYRGGCTGFGCQVGSHLKCLARCAGPRL